MACSARRHRSSPGSTPSGSTSRSNLLIVGDALILDLDLAQISVRDLSQIQIQFSAAVDNS
jgi:hypothetical protein